MDDDNDDGGGGILPAPLFSLVLSSPPERKTNPRGPGGQQRLYIATCRLLLLLPLGAAVAIPALLSELLDHRQSRRLSLRAGRGRGKGMGHSLRPDVADVPAARPHTGHARRKKRWARDRKRAGQKTKKLSIFRTDAPPPPAASAHKGG